MCSCRQRATAEDCLTHPWLNGHSHSVTRLLPSMDEREASQSESDPEPESPGPSPELVIVASYTLCPGQGEIKAGRGGVFPFEEPLIQQELIC